MFSWVETDDKVSQGDGTMLHQHHFLSLLSCFELNTVCVLLGSEIMFSTKKIIAPFRGYLSSEKLS